MGDSRRGFFKKLFGGAAVVGAATVPYIPEVKSEPVQPVRCVLGKSSLPAGTPVRISSEGVFVPAQNENRAGSRVMAVVSKKGECVNMGEVELDHDFALGAPLYLQADGSLSSNLPHRGHMVQVAYAKPGGAVLAIQYLGQRAC